MGLFHRVDWILPQHVRTAHEPESSGPLGDCRASPVESETTRLHAQQPPDAGAPRWPWDVLEHAASSIRCRAFPDTNVEHTLAARGRKQGLQHRIPQPETTGSGLSAQPSHRWVSTSSDISDPSQPGGLGTHRRAANALRLPCVARQEQRGHESQIDRSVGRRSPSARTTPSSIRPVGAGQTVQRFTL